MNSYPFTILGGPAPFQDTIRMEASEWEALTTNEQEALKMARYNNWIESISVPPGDPEVFE
jgi:hypothetical protein